MDWLSVFWFSLVLISLGAAAYFTERHEAKKREEERGEREERRRLAPEEGPSPLPCYEYGSIGGRPIYYKGLAITFTRPPPTFVIGGRYLTGHASTGQEESKGEENVESDIEQPPTSPKIPTPDEEHEEEGGPICI